ncbi:uncharacterized protein LOC143373815 isoform X2 [Andrena cerasifolii]|uniref:uncharacterized protein LOC143373815 isoform X2 n=1 Tax=Andrena cerasifolii TaxID=2819439 RepID=UPI0040384E76
MSIARIWQLTSLLIISSPRIFSADNFCPRIENYTVTSKETYTEPVTVNTFTWCLQIPPRCPKTRTEMRQRYRVKTESKTRSVNECCEGYQMISSNDNETDIRCVPLCEKCLSGVCVSPNQCQCDPGYLGDNCATACPPGTWGPQCKEKCNCTDDVHCNPVNGRCVYTVCPAGLHGKTCDESCPSDRWGPDCALTCNCGGQRNECHPETGRCADDHVPVESTSITASTEEEDNEVLDITTTERNEESSAIWETEATTEASDGDRGVTNPPKTTIPGTTASTTLDHPKIRTQPREDASSNTARPVIVLVSVPDRRRNLEKDRGKFAMKTPFLVHVNDNVGPRDVASSKIDFVKNIHTGTDEDEMQLGPYPSERTLIAVASIVCLGLTMVIIVVVLHMHSKILDPRISTYEEARMKSQENASAGRISSMVTGTLPLTPICVSPFYTSTSEPATMLSILNSEPLNIYTNGAATIGHRVSGNLHGFPQDDHYDRPPSTRIRLQSDLEATTEHIYDEIPLQSSPPHPRKSA